MSAVRKWLRKVLTGLAAFLLVSLEFLGNHIPYAVHPLSYSYSWSEHGMRVVWEEQQREHLARLEGDVREEDLRRDMKTARDRSDRNNGKAAS